MNLNQLRYLAAVAETGSFSEAAKLCCVTQPTLSNGIAQLEKHLGGKLFRRTTRSVALTPFGEFALPMALAVLDAKDELEHAAQSFFEPQTRILRIGMSPLVDNPLLSRALAHLPNREAWSEVFLKQCFLDDLIERLEHETLDLALLPQGTQAHGLEAAVLYEEELFYLPPHVDLTSATASDSISVKELQNQPIILTQGCGLSDVIANLFDDAGVPLVRYPGQALSYGVVEEWAGLGIAGGILPRSKLSTSTNGARAILNGDGEVAKVGYEAVWSSANAHGGEVAACAGYLCKTMRALAAGMATP